MMEALMAKYLETLELAEPQNFRNMTVVPLLTPADGNQQYLTLAEALKKKQIKIKEVNDSGSVPELAVMNAAEVPVLLLDGEELKGAKQNRVLNTTILVEQGIKLTVPVSCTEHGRWSYESHVFHDSAVVLSPKVRGAKVASVSQSLEEDRAFASDQSAVWDGIAERQACARVNSHTGAMRDVYKARKGNLDEYLKAFKPIEGQKGLLVIINGKAAGFDVVSRAPAYRLLHDRLARSYALDAMLDREKGTAVDYKAVGAQFISDAGKCGEKIYPSVGLGWDYRFEGDSMVGSALAHKDEVIHMAFFRSPDGPEHHGPISSYRMRRGFRTHRHGSGQVGIE